MTRKVRAVEISTRAYARGVYKAMDRAGAIRAFSHDVVEKLRA
jgi:hypothetical protein